MGSINDYGRRPARPTAREEGSWGGPPPGRWKRRLLIQTGAAALLFLAVAAGINADNLLGRSARYIAVTGLSPESGWLWNGADPDVAPVSAPPTEAPAPEVGAEGPGDVVLPGLPLPETAEAPPTFTAPASGVVVTDLAVEASGFSTELGILIQGSQGQSVKAAAEGSVRYLGESEDGFIVELEHSGGFTSVYQGLSQVNVSPGQDLRLGEVLGTTADGEVTFSLLRDGAEVNPLEYLFQQK